MTPEARAYVNRIVATWPPLDDDTADQAARILAATPRDP
jgi:hypothetical protein